MASVLSDALANRLKVLDSWFGQNKSKIEAVINEAKRPKGPKPGVGGGSCTRVWFLSFRSATGGSAILRVIFRQAGEEDIEEDWLIGWEEKLESPEVEEEEEEAPSVRKSWNELATVVANPDIFTLTLDGGDLPNGEVEIRIKGINGWSVELAWSSEGDNLEGDHTGGLNRGYGST